MDAPSFNPYAPPQVSNPVAATGDCYRQGKLLIVPRQSAPFFPCDTCVKCGQPATGTVRRTLAWHHPALFLLILLYLLIYLVVALIVSKRMRITIGLCDAHRAVRRRWIIGAWLLFFSSVALFFLGFSSQTDYDPRFLVGGTGALLLTLVSACVVSYLTLRPRRITKEEGTFAGAGEGFLQQFPGQ